MNVAEVLKADHVNGPGMRVSLFVSGCTNQCPDCFNPETWDFAYGVLYTPDMEEEILTELSKPYYQGMTILGGEPFEEQNQEELIHLIRRVKTELPDKDIWMFTGFVYEEDLVPGGCRHISVTDEILDSIDVLVDGRYVESLKDLRLLFRGSSNQRLIDMKKTRRSGKVCLWNWETD